MTSWGWSAARARTARGGGLAWLQPFSTAVPWITVGVLLMMLFAVSGAFTAHEGVLFDLPEAGLGDGVNTKLVALVMPMPKETRKTLVFFDDARFTVEDDVSLAAFAGQLSACAERSEVKALLVLADRRVSGGTLMRLAAVAKRSGVDRILFAEKKGEGGAPE